MMIIKHNMFDTICHEHLEYYSVTFINKLLKKHNLRIFDHFYNNINGGSSAYLICHSNAKYKTNKSKINKVLLNEKKFGIEKVSTYKNFKKRIDLMKKKLNLKIKKIIKNNKIIHGYAASTKGNVLLQYYNLDKKNKIYFRQKSKKNKSLYTRFKY